MKEYMERAFPVPYGQTNGMDGMSLRDYLAAHAPIDLQAVHAAWGGKEEHLTHDGTRAGFMAVWAMLCYEYADAMLREREEKK